MRNFTFLVSALLSITFIVTACKKQPVDQLSLLPPATQTGANTFGCLANGKAFLPKTYGFMVAPPLVCQYNSNGLFLVAGYKDNNGNYTDITIGTDSLELAEGQAYQLKTRVPGSAYATYQFIGGSIVTYMTNDSISGSLTISKLDISNNVISGTFNFKAVDTANNKTIELTGGRFDLHFN